MPTDQTQPDLSFLDTFDLTPKERLFVCAYIETGNASESARRSGYSGKRSNEAGYQILTKPHIRAAVTEGRRKVEAKALVGAQDVARKLWDIANASPADVVQLRRGACRYCHGTQHRYQWRDVVEREEVDPEAAPVGGYGYRKTAVPHPKCPRCDGLGIAYTHIPDMRHLDHASRDAVQGIKETKHGVEIRFADRLKAIDALAKNLGLFDDGAVSAQQELAEAIMAVARPIPVASQAPDYGTCDEGQ